MGTWVWTFFRRGLGPRKKLLAVALAFVLLTAGALFGFGGKSAPRLVMVADTRDMGPGLSRWIADLYNTNLWLYGLVVILTMALQGVLLGFLFDRLIARLGIHLTRTDPRE